MNGDPERYSVKEILTLFVLPELANKADGKDVEDLKKEIAALEAKVLTPDSVAAMVGAALDKKEARGWTKWEKRFAIGFFAFALIGAAGTIIQLVLP